MENAPHHKLLLDLTQVIKEQTVLCYQIPPFMNHASLKMRVDSGEQGAWRLGMETSKKHAVKR